jgi:SPP1 gp7 family putative phage head morphogenesis protein
MSSAKVEAVQRLVRESVQAVDALSPVALRAVLPALRAVRDELQTDVRGWLDGADYRGAFTALQRTGMLRALEGTFDRVRELDPAMAGALAAGRHATGPLAIHNLDTEITRLSAIFGNGMPQLPDIKTAAVLAQGDKLLWRRHESSAKRYAGQVGDDIKHLLAVGVAKHESIEQLVARLRKLGPGPRVVGGDPGADAARIAEGMFARHRWWADRLVRTETMHAYNVQHDVATVHANENRPDGEPEYVRRWDASMDSRVCPICAGLDGKTAPIGGMFPGGYDSPPAHSCCRCTVLAWNPAWGEMRTATDARAAARPEPEPEPIRHEDGPVAIENRAADHAPDGWRIGVGRIHEHATEVPDVVPTQPAVVAREHVPESAYRAAAERAAAKLVQVVEAAEKRAAPEAEAVIWEHKKNPKRVEAARKAGEASVERRREIHSAVASNLPQELQATWGKEGHKFMQQEAARIRGVKDPINAASKISEAFAEQYGSGSETSRGYEGDRYHRRAEIEAKHAESWADEQEKKYYAAAARSERQVQPARAPRTSQKSKHDDDVPF